MQNGESDLLNLFKQGNEDAFETLFRQHQRAVYGWILRITRDPAAAEEPTIESFWRIHRARERFLPTQGFEGWARRIATRAALDWLRARRPTHEFASEMTVDYPAPVATDAAVIADIRLKTAQAFSRLPPKLRIAATLVLIEEQPQKEIAAALDISVAAVKLRVFRALRLLRKDLERQGIMP